MGACHAWRLDAAYDTIGRTYTATRAEDPRIAARLHAALGDAETVVNVGAGAGAYEPRDRWVLAVEPSETMVAQRPAGGAPVVRATAEQLPLADATVDARRGVLPTHRGRGGGGGGGEWLRAPGGGVGVGSSAPEATAAFGLVRASLPEPAEPARGRFPP